MLCMKFLLERCISTCPDLKLPGNLLLTSRQKTVTLVFLASQYKATPSPDLTFSYSNTHKMGKTIYCIHWGCIVKHALLTAESIIILTKKKTTKRVAQNREGEFEQASCSRNTKTCGHCVRTHLDFPAKQTFKNSSSATAHLNTSVTTKIWSGKTMTCTVLFVLLFFFFLFLKGILKRQQIKGADVLLPSFPPCMPSPPPGTCYTSGLFIDNQPSYISAFWSLLL